MAGLFTKQRHDIGKLHYILKIAFERVKTDMHNIFSWVNYFHQKHQQHDERLAKIEQQLAAPRREIEYASAPSAAIDQLRGRLEELHMRLDSLETQKPAPKAALKERLLRKISRNSKEYIKSVILGTIKKYERIQGPQLKEIVVEEQGLCSKSSFYRLLHEIEEEQEIASFTEGKEKTYFLKTQILK
ncbi:hypothetical protein KY332_04005 [Candidatus Woesearchaeota archaeon]|nr:hypothetical protein [Candidatus Woesearchaeota archaeon]